MIARLAPACVAVLLLAGSAFGQAVDAKKFSRLKVAEESRARLAERLKLFIGYELTEQYEKQYDLLVTKCPATLQCENESREEYVKGKRAQRNIYGPLVELKIRGTYGKFKDNCIYLSADPKFRKDGVVSFNANSMVACLQDGDWYFRFWLIEI